MLNPDLNKKAQACPDTNTYGDQSAENYLEFGREERVYRFYFDQSGYVKYKQSRDFELILPGFGSISGPLAHLQVNFKKIIGEGYNAYDIFIEGSESLSPYKCVELSRVFENRDSVTTEVRDFLFALSKHNKNRGTFKSKFKLTNRHNSNEYIKGHWEASKIVHDDRNQFSTDQNENPGFISTNGGSEDLQIAWINYNGNQNALKFSLKPPRQHPITKQINDFQGPGRYIQMENGEIFVYDVKQLEPHSSRVRIYELPSEKLRYNHQSFFTPDLPDPDKLDMQRLGIYAYTKSKNITYVPATTPVRYHGLKSSKTEARLDLTQKHEKQASFDTFYNKLKPSDQTYSVHYKNPDRVNPIGLEDHSWSFFLFPNVTLKPELRYAPHPDNPESYNQALQTFHQYKQIKRAFEQEDPDTSAYIDELADLWKEKGLKGDEPEKVAETGKAFRQALLEKHNEEEEGLELAFNTLESKAFEAYPVKLKIDKKSGLPEERTHRLPDNTEVTINYEGSNVQMIAENEKQGRHKKSLNVVDNILDIHQLHHNLAYLPLEVGYQGRLPLLDIKHKDTTYQVNEDSTVSKMLIEPAYMLAFPHVKDTTEIQTSEGETVKAFKVNMEFRGDVNRFPLYKLFNAGHDRSYSLTYYMRREAPHQIIRIESNDHGNVIEGRW